MGLIQHECTETLPWVELRSWLNGGDQWEEVVISVSIR